MKTIPCWICEMSDEDAYMALALNNAQGELNTLERGLHALGSPLGVREYAKATGTSPKWVTFQRQAAEVFTQVNTKAGLGEKTKHLVEIYATPRWLWRSLVSRLVSEGWTVEQARGAAQRFKETAEKGCYSPFRSVGRNRSSEQPPVADENVAGKRQQHAQPRCPFRATHTAVARREQANFHMAATANLELL